jgi:hypothetical protein
MLMTDDDIDTLGKSPGLIDKLWNQFTVSLMSVLISSFLSFLVFLILYIPKGNEETLNEGLLTNNIECIKKA